MRPVNAVLFRSIPVSMIAIVTPDPVRPAVYAGWAFTCAATLELLIDGEGVGVGVGVGVGGGTGVGVGVGVGVGLGTGGGVVLTPLVPAPPHAETNINAPRAVITEALFKARCAGWAFGCAGISGSSGIFSVCA
jgi:hypothetical protein